MFFEPLAEMSLGELACSKRHHHRVRFFFVGGDFPSILLEENVREDESDSLVAINKGMILAHMESVGRRFVEESLVNKFTANGHLWVGKGRIKEAGISQSWSSTISLQQIRVNGGDNPIGNEACGHYFPRA